MRDSRRSAAMSDGADRVRCVVGAETPGAEDLVAHRQLRIVQARQPDRSTSVRKNMIVAVATPDVESTVLRGNRRRH
jgi:hypothetical protein